jgi:predicted dehydrogenase
MVNRRVELRKGGRGGAGTEVAVEALPPERAEPIAYMIEAIKTGKGVEGLTALDINLDVVEIIEAAKQSVKTSRAVTLPLKP